jgi:hypothetical protein
MRRIFVVVVVAGVGLAGCGLAVAACDGHGACKVDVSVTNCVPTPDPEPLPVTGKNINIFWELDTASMFFYRFRDDDGVILKTASTEFDQPAAQGNNKKFKLHDKNSLAGQHTYPYTIKVQRLVLFQWVDCPPLDPSIVNQG